jgi:hypothetical protein
MTNNVKDVSIPIQLDKERHLRYDLNAFIELEEKFGSIQDALDLLSDLDPGAKAKTEKGKKIVRHDLKTVRAFLWAGLVAEDETLTERDVGKLITFQNVANVFGAIMNAVDAAMPELGEEEIKNFQSPAP